MLQLLKDALAVIYPVICRGCGEHLLPNEEAICYRCVDALPYTNHHYQTNIIAEKLRGIEPITGVYALAYQNSGNLVEQLVHQLKYNNQTQVGVKLGELLGEKLNKIDLYFDTIIPVPLHQKKQAKRGYNQSEKIAKGIHNCLNIALETKALERVVYTSSQTKKNRMERYEAMKNVFKADKELIAGKKILLVDDVITTGATSLSCAKTLFEAGATEVLLVSVGYANPF